MSVLLIREAEQQQIDIVVARAKANPIPIETIKRGAAPDDVGHTVRLKDRKPGFERPRSEHVLFPGNFRAAYSVEEQPAGLCSHLSVSVFGRAFPGTMPSPAAVELIAKAFGVPFPPDHLWQEEFEPGEYAVNLLSLIKDQS